MRELIVMDTQNPPTCKFLSNKKQDELGWIHLHRHVFVLLKHC